MASVVRRRKEDGGGYQVRYYGPDGKRRARTFKTRREAVEFSISVEADMARGGWADPRGSDVKFGDYISVYLGSGVHWRPATRIKVQGHVNNYILPAFGDYRVADIRPQDVRDFVAALAKHGLASGTIRGIYSSLSRVLRQAGIDGVISRSPCVGIALPPDKVARDPVFLDVSQINDLASVLEERYRALIYTAAFTGLRWGELVALKTKNVDLNKGTIRVAESANEVLGHFEEGPTKTGKGRSVSMPRFLISMLRAHMQHFSAGGYVFTSAEGKALRRNFYRRHFVPAVTSAGLPETLPFHDLRHTCAALSIAQGAHPKEIQERLGHSTIRMTFDRYGHLFPTLDDRLRDGLDAAFEAGKNESP